MNRLQGLGCKERYFVSLNVSRQINPERVLARFRYEHPVFTPEGIRAQASWGEVSGTGGIHYAGAWLRNGFHEDGAVTGRRAAEQVLSQAAAEPEMALAA
jgi:predicted NAD/FAD-binding protein